MQMLRSWLHAWTSQLSFSLTLIRTRAFVSAALQSDVQTVPVMAGPPGDGRGARLTSAQQEELEMARRRAEKAAKGKAANTAAVARRAKRRNSYSSDRSDDDLQQKLSTVTDEKEAKRLKRCAHVVEPCLDTDWVRSAPLALVVPRPRRFRHLPDTAGFVSLQEGDMWVMHTQHCNCLELSCRFQVSLALYDMAQATAQPRIGAAGTRAQEVVRCHA